MRFSGNLKVLCFLAVLSAAYGYVKYPYLDKTDICIMACDKCYKVRNKIIIFNKHIFFIQQSYVLFTYIFIQRVFYKIKNETPSCRTWVLWTVPTPASQPRDDLETNGRRRARVYARRKMKYCQSFTIESLHLIRQHVIIEIIKN